MVKVICPKCGSIRMFNDSCEYEECYCCGDKKRKQINLNYVNYCDEDFYYL